MGYALINLKRRRKKGLDPKGLISPGTDNFPDTAQAFNDSGKHAGKIRLFCILFWNKTPIRLIFASLKSPKEVLSMLIIDSKDCENIDKALKKYKKKFEKAKILLQLRDRQSFTKPSVRRRNQVLKAVYKQKIASGKIEA